MKTAILYCGHARSISQTWENHRWFLLRYFPQIDFFCSIVDDAQADDMLKLRECRPDAGWQMEKVVQPEIPWEPEKTKWKMGYQRSTTPQGVLKQLWALNRCWDFFAEKGKPSDYDVVVRVRPDLCFMRLEIPRDRVFESASPRLCLTPWWSRWNGINDRFAIMGPDAAQAYFTAHLKWPSLAARGCPLHPETIMRESLLMDGIVPDDTLSAEFLTIRLPDAQHRDFWGIPCDPTVIDVADYARK